MTLALTLADWLLTLVHVAVVGAFVLGWIPRRATRFYPWLVAGVAASWLVLGAWKGLGYCVLTDWHWQVKRARGEGPLPGSFLKYAADSLTGGDVPPRSVDAVAGVVFVLGVCIAVALAWRSRYHHP